jgi:type VI secretion system protein ImpA
MAERSAEGLSPQLLARLLAPFPGEAPGGEDVAFAPELDEIRRARQGDDAGLAQGEWVREVKPPQWTAVRERSERILLDRSKDLQVACWYAEALTRTEGFPGLAFGLAVLDGFLSDLWAGCHPALADRDLEERAGRFAWLEARLPGAIRDLPMTGAAAGGHGWSRWNEAMQVDNLGLRDPGAREAALAEGKLSGELFQKAVRASGPGFHEGLLAGIREAQAALERVRAGLETRFGPEGPALDEVAAALQGCADLARQILARQAPRSPEGGTEAPGIASPSGAGPASGPAPGWAAAPAGPRATPLATPTEAFPALRSREEAVEQLLEIAAWFRDHEPHSPVAPLAERAARWARMPLDRWLAQVIKDEGTLRALQELLDVGGGRP